MASLNLVHQLGLDLAVRERGFGVYGRNLDLLGKSAMADGLIRTRIAAEVGDVGVVFCQPVNVAAVQYLLVEGRDTWRGSIDDLRKEMTVATARTAGPPQHLDDLHVGDDAAAVVSEVRARRRRSKVHGPLR